MDQVEQVLKRTKAYQYGDGLLEILTGVVFALVATLNLAEARWPSVRPFGAVGLMLVVCGGVLGGQRLVRLLKERLVFPRTGQVTYRKPSRARLWISVTIALVIAALGGVFFLRADPTLVEQWFPMLQALPVSLFLVFLGFSFSVPRFHVLAGLSISLGLLVSVCDLGRATGSGAYFGAVGVLFAASGLLVLRSYLHHAPAPERDPIEP